MLLKLWHWFIGAHRWELVSVSKLLPARVLRLSIGQSPLSRDQKRLLWGAAEITHRCRCGASSTIMIYGEITETGQDELKELRRMAGL